jgi:hypothetical protein
MLTSMKKPLYPHPSKDGLTIDYDKEDFNKSLPYLANELEDRRSQGHLQINGIEQDPENLEDKNQENDFPIEEIEEINLNNQNPLKKEFIVKNNVEGPVLNADLVSQVQQKRKKIEDYLSKQSNSSDNQELYNPKAEDFIRRCDTLEQVEEVIEYLLKRKEISVNDAQILRDKIRIDGLTSYGPKKTWGYFERKYRRESEIKNDLGE